MVVNHGCDEMPLQLNLVTIDCGKRVNIVLLEIGIRSRLLEPRRLLFFRWLMPRCDLTRYFTDIQLFHDTKARARTTSGRSGPHKITKPTVAIVASRKTRIHRRLSIGWCAAHCLDTVSYTHLTLPTTPYV